MAEGEEKVKILVENVKIVRWACERFNADYVGHFTVSVILSFLYYWKYKFDFSKIF